MADLISRAAAVRALASSNGDYLDALERFERLPAVDAVPVEWILKFCEDDISEDDQIAIGWMLGVWQREQEAR